MYVYMCVSIYVCMYVRMPVWICVYGCMYVYMDLCVYVCMYLRMYVFMVVHFFCMYI